MPEYETRAPRFIQLMSAGADLFALDERGRVWMLRGVKGWVMIPHYEVSKMKEELKANA